MVTIKVCSFFPDTRKKVRAISPARQSVQDDGREREREREREMERERKKDDLVTGSHFQLEPRRDVVLFDGYTNAL